MFGKAPQACCVCTENGNSIRRKEEEAWCASSLSFPRESVGKNTIVTITVSLFCVFPTVFEEKRDCSQSRRSLKFNSVLKLNFHFDNLKLSSKTVRKLLFNESYCFNDEKSLDEILFSKKHSVYVSVYFCILNLTFSLQDILRW